MIEIWSLARLTPVTRKDHTMDHIKEFLKKYEAFDEVATRIRLYEGEQLTPLHKASECDLMAVIDSVMSLLTSLPAILEDASYQLAWKRAEEDEKDDILFRHFPKSITR
jgi:hypothetical protein